MNKKIFTILAVILLVAAVLIPKPVSAVESFILSEQEEAIVRSYPVLYVAIVKKGFPFEFYNRYEKQYEGVIVQILKSVTAQTGFNFEYILTDDTDEAIQNGINMQTDITTSYVKEGTDFILGKQLAHYDGQIVAIQYTRRVPIEVVSLIDRAIDTISQEDISSIIAKQATQYEKMFDNTKVNLVIIIAFAVLLISLLITIIVTYKKYKKLKMRFINTDRLTGYPNIAGMKEITDVAISSMNISSYCMVNLTVFNLDYIREVFGYAQADKVQEDIAVLLDESIYNNEIIARAENDDFIMLLQFSEKPETASRIRLIIDKVNEKYSLKKSEFPIILSIGIYCPKYEETNMDLLMQKSLQARSFIKEKDEARFTFYDETMHILSVEENLLQQEFVQSMEKEEFLIYIQPKVLLADNSICGGELLSRWYNPRRGLIRPGEYIHIFEKSGTIIIFDMYMFEKACQLISISRKANRKVVPLSVNFARSHFTNTAFCDNILEIANRYQVPPYYLNIEVTESLISENPKVMNEIAKKLKEYGFTISLDDFGTGYASFSDLTSFMLDFLKLDKSMVYNLDNQKTRKMIKGISGIAHSMDMEIICEGVETKEQLEILKSLDCDIVQGYYFYQPMPYEEFVKILEA